MANHPIALSTAFLSLLLVAISGIESRAQQGVHVSGRSDPQLFEGQPSEMAPNIFGDSQKTNGVLRVLTVEERVGYARTNELVRVPLFFHAGECADPNALGITLASGEGQPIAYQADDIRRDSNGKVCRMHVYFYCDLAAWQRKQFNVTAGTNPGARQSVLPITERDGKVILGGEEIQVTFHARGKLAGAIAGIETGLGKVTIPEQNLAPETKVLRQDKQWVKTRESDISYYTNPEAITVKDMRWSSGPIFSKLIVKVAPAAAPEDIAEYQFIIPKYGSQFVMTELFYPEQKDCPDTVGTKGSALLTGKLFLGDAPGDQEIVSVPVGLRKELRTVFNHRNKALVNTKACVSLLVVPYVQERMGDIAVEPDGRVFFRQTSDFRTDKESHSESLRVFWAQARFIFSKATTVEDLWMLGCKNFQPLTAVVDEPWATPQDLMEFAKQASREYWKVANWRPNFEAHLALSFLTSGADGLDKIKAAPEPDLRQQIPSQEAIDAAAKTGKGAGDLDPYQITYSFSGVVPFSAFVTPSEKLDSMAAIKGEASRLINGRVTPYGWPHVKSWGNAANMHQGTYLCGIWGGRKTGDKDLVQWCWDAVTSQNYKATYGHGQRPYSMNEGGSDGSDELYISITDYWQRAMELICNEDLSIHPSVYGRYFDCVDVNADIYQRKLTDLPAGGKPAWWRAMMFRGQSHDHRWEAFGCDPFLGMLGNAADHGKVGVTEACYYIQREIEKTKTWNTTMTDLFFPAMLATKGLANYHPPKLPPLPGRIKVTYAPGRNIITWDAVPEAAGYRVYRAAAMGGPWTWVNSPYARMPPFKPMSGADKAAAQAAAEADDAATAQRLGIEVKKLKQADKARAWEKLPKVWCPPFLTR